MKEQEKLDRIYENICKKKNCGTCKHCKDRKCEVGLKCGTIHQGVKNCPKWERVNPKEKAMTKHYCDMCGEEIKEYEKAVITISPNDDVRCCVEGDEEFELCPECAGKVSDFIMENGVCQN